jgi:hypothetical protein
MDDYALIHVHVNDSQIENLMLTFHLVPTIEVFNYVILSDGEMYREDEPDRTDEFYIEYADEDWKTRRARIRGLKKELDARKGKPVGSHRANYSNPLKLAWVCAAVKAFPWLIDKCARPLYIERAYKFTDNSLFYLTQQVVAGPLPRQKVVPGACGTPVKDSASRWVEQCKALARINLMRFGASDNHWYVDNIRESVKESERGQFALHTVAVDEFNTHLYYDFDIMYEKIEPKENAVDLAEKLIQRAQDKIARVRIDL